LFGRTGVPTLVVSRTTRAATSQGSNGMEGNTITRRQILKGVGLFAGGALLGSGLTPAGTQRESGTARGAERPWHELGIIGEPIMDNQLLWYLSHTGQGMAIREQGLTFRPDWEKVVTPVVDFALELPGVEPEGIILMGLSMEGQLAPRAVAFEKRIRICIANPGVVNWAEALMKAWPTAGRWFRDAAWKHGATSPADLMTKLKDFNNEGVVDRIDCQMLIMDGTAEESTPGQAKKLYDALKCPKDYMLFTEEDTGLVHCQAGALNVATRRMFDWLDERI
jgi:hypothetical protein